eukprot:1256115-Prymnesium_polylepis.1
MLFGPRALCPRARAACGPQAVGAAHAPSRAVGATRAPYRAVRPPARFGKARRTNTAAAAAASAHLDVEVGRRAHLFADLANASERLLL